MAGDPPRSSAGGPQDRTDDEAARRDLLRLRRHLPPGLALGQRLAGKGRTEVAAEGSWITMSDGERMLDLGSYGVTTIGHRHPSIVEAVSAQLHTLPTSTRSLPNGATAGFAADLVDYVSIEGLDRVWIGSTGSEAVECALKMAKLATGKHRVLGVVDGFHGQTLGALAATHRPSLKVGLEPSLASATHLDPTDPLAARRACADGDVAALIVEPVLGEGGVRPLDLDVVRAWAADVTQAGGFVIADEIQCGLLRAGSPTVSGTEGLSVDAVLLGKALGGGVMPLSAVVCSASLYQPFLIDPFIHSSTFGGHPLACAAGSAAIDVLHDAVDEARHVGSMFEQGLRKVITDIGQGERIQLRGQALMWGLDITEAGLAGELLIELFHAGLVVSPCLTRPAVIRLLPSTWLTSSECAYAMETLATTLDRVLNP